MPKPEVHRNRFRVAPAGIDGSSADEGVSAYGLVMMVSANAPRLDNVGAPAMFRDG
jgi:hypothetical protein